MKFFAMQINREKVVFISDTTHGIEIVKKLGANIFIVVSEHQSRGLFEKCEATVVDLFNELCSLIAKFCKILKIFYFNSCIFCKNVIEYIILNFIVKENKNETF